MLVSCPTCPAQYEVADKDVGPEGRVVECSACGARWLQPSLDAADADPAAPSTIPGMDDARRALAEMKAPVAPEGDDDDGAAAPEEGLRRETLYGHDDDEADDEPAAPISLRKPAAEASPTTHPTPGRAAAEPTPMRRGGPDLRPARPIDDEAQSDPRGARRMARDLPDASRLNAELRASAHDEERVDRRRRSGFRTGLWLVLLIGGVGAGLYYGKAEIEARLPQSAPYLDSYVAAVNDAQVKIMNLADQAMAKIMPLINGEAPAPAAPAPAAPTPAAPAPGAQTPAVQPPAMQAPAAPTSPAGGAAPASSQGSVAPTAPRMAAPASAVMIAPEAAPSAAPSLPAVSPSAAPAASTAPQG
jgi:predicted Zn finger-like uncharacterized protein